MKKKEQKIPIFTVPDIIRFIRWADDRYRLDAIIATGEDQELINIIYEYITYINQL